MAPLASADQARLVTKHVHVLHAQELGRRLTRLHETDTETVPSFYR